MRGFSPRRAGLPLALAVAVVALLMPGSAAATTLTPSCLQTSLAPLASIRCAVNVTPSQYIGVLAVLHGAAAAGDLTAANDMSAFTTALANASVCVYEADGTTMGFCLSGTIGGPATSACTTKLVGTDAAAYCLYNVGGVDKLGIGFRNAASSGAAKTLEVQIFESDELRGGEANGNGSQRGPQAQAPASAAQKVYLDPTQANAVSGPLTDTQLRASAVAVSDSSTHTKLDTLHSDMAGAGGPASTVTLSTADSDRLDLMWWGLWALVGLAFVSLIAPRFLRALAPERGLS